MAAMLKAGPMTERLFTCSASSSTPASRRPATPEAANETVSRVYLSIAVSHPCSDGGRITPGSRSEFEDDSDAVSERRRSSSGSQAMLGNNPFRIRLSLSEETGHRPSRDRLVSSSCEEDRDGKRRVSVESTSSTAPSVDAFYDW